MVRGSVYFLPVHIIKHWACWSTTRDTWHCCLQHTHPPVSPPPPLVSLSLSPASAAQRSPCLILPGQCPNFLFHPDSMATLLPWRAALTFAPPALKTKARSYGGRESCGKGELWGGWRICRNEGGNNRKVSGMEALRRDLICSMCQSPIKSRELLL